MKRHETEMNQSDHFMNGSWLAGEKTKVNNTILALDPPTSDMQQREWRISKSNGCTYCGVSIKHVSHVSGNRLCWSPGIKSSHDVILTARESLAGGREIPLCTRQVCECLFSLEFEQSTQLKCRSNQHCPEAPRSAPWLRVIFAFRTYYASCSGKRLR